MGVHRGDRRGCHDGAAQRCGGIRREAEALPVPDRPRRHVRDGQLGDRHHSDERGRQVRPGRAAPATRTPSPRRGRSSSSTASRSISGRPSSRAWRRTPSTATASTSEVRSSTCSAPDASPVFRTQIPAGSSAPYKFAVLGNWGKTLAAGNPYQANVISQIAQSGARFAVTAGDNAYEVGSQKSYGDLYQVGDNTSAVFGPNYWKVAGASLPIFPTIGNHDHNNSVLLTNFPQDTAVADIRRSVHRRRRTAAPTERIRPTIRTAGTRSTPAWRASTCSRRPGRTRTSAPPTSSRTTSTTTGGPIRRSTSGSRTISRPIPGRCASRSTTSRCTRTSRRPAPTRSPGSQFPGGAAEARTT